MQIRFEQLAKSIVVLGIVSGSTLLGIQQSIATDLITSEALLINAKPTEASVNARTLQQASLASSVVSPTNAAAHQHTVAELFLDAMLAPPAPRFTHRDSTAEQLEQQLSQTPHQYLSQNAPAGELTEPADDITPLPEPAPVLPENEPAPTPTPATPSNG
ncbi:MAG: hypothetical protein AAF528_01455, partial [Cyanobacteria bacterium P01_C01_bin.121]